jgi:hypothetical protein
MYRLKYDPAAEAVHDALPQDASEQLSAALAAACGDPWSATEPYGEDDGVIRTLLAGDTFAVLLVGHNLKTITVLQISWIG